MATKARYLLTQTPEGSPLARHRVIDGTGEEAKTEAEAMLREGQAPVTVWIEKAAAYLTLTDLVWLERERREKI